MSIDGVKKEFQMYALVDAAGGKANYIQIRDLAMALNNTQAQFSVIYDGGISLKTKTPYSPNGSKGKRAYFGSQPYKINTSAIKVNGQSVTLDSFVINDSNGGGHTYFKLRDLGDVLDLTVGCSKEQGVYIQTK